jgi:hypothetical protein
MIGFGLVTVWALMENLVTGGPRDGTVVSIITLGVLVYTTSIALWGPKPPRRP